MANIDTSYGWGTTVSSLTLVSADVALLGSWLSDAVDELLNGDQCNSSVIAFLVELKSVIASVETHFA